MLDTEKTSEKGKRFLRGTASETNNTPVILLRG